LIERTRVFKFLFLGSLRGQDFLSAYCMNSKNQEVFSSLEEQKLRVFRLKNAQENFLWIFPLNNHQEAIKRSNTPSPSQKQRNLSLEDKVLDKPDGKANIKIQKGRIKKFEFGTFFTRSRFNDLFAF